MYTGYSNTKGERQMLRKMGAVLISVLLLTGLGRTAAAAEETGSIRITLNTVEGEVSLYHAGTPVDGGYRLSEEFGGGFIKEEDAQSPYLAQWLAETAATGRNLLLDADGSAEFSRLEAGLYLLKQTESADGETPISPFLVVLPYYGQWNIQANPKTGTASEPPRTAQGPEPFLGMAGMLLSGSGLLVCAGRRKRK